MIRAVASLARKDAPIAAASTVLRSVGRMLLALMVARSAETSAFALFTLLIAIEAIVVCAANAMYASPAAVLIQKRSVRLQHMINACAESWQRATGLLVGMGSLLAWGTGLVTADLGITIAVAMAAIIEYQGRRSTYISLFRSRQVLASEIAIALIGALVALPLLQEAPLLAFWLGQAAAHSLALAIVRPAPRLHECRGWQRRLIRRSLLALGTKMLVGSLAVSLTSRTQPILLAVTIGSTGVATYGIAAMCAAPIRLAGGAIRGVALPRFAAARTNKQRSNWPPTRCVLFAIGTAAALGLLSWPMSTVVVPEFLGSQHAHAVRYVPWLVATAVLASAVSLASAACQACGKSGTTATTRWILALAAPLVLYQLGTSGGLMMFILGLLLLEVVAGVILLILFTHPMRDGATRSQTGHGVASAC